MIITPHFRVEEFACKDGTPYPAEWVQSRLLPLCETLEVIREAVGKPIRVDSGYRTLAYDQRLYDADQGAGNVALPQGSQHPKGRAVDIRCGSLRSVQLRDLIAELFIGGKLPRLGGLGLYPTFVHVDIRDRGPRNHLAQWGGTRYSNIA